MVSPTVSNCPKSSMQRKEIDEPALENIDNSFYAIGYTAIPIIGGLSMVVIGVSNAIPAMYIAGGVISGSGVFAVFARCFETNKSEVLNSVCRYTPVSHRK